jgi:hypothetical protein
MKFKPDNPFFNDIRADRMIYSNPQTIQATVFIALFEYVKKLFKIA